MPLGSLFSEAPLNFCDNPTLSNEWVTLEPLGLQHAEALAACVGDLSSLWYQDHIPTPGESARVHRDKILASDLVRDTCVYSILDIEWPEVKTSLKARLNR